MARAKYKEAVRIRTETTEAEAVPSPAYDWNHGKGGSVGWGDFPVALDDAPLRFVSPPAYPQTKGGVRSMNTALPVAGAYMPELGTTNTPFFPELLHPALKSLFGGFSGAETAGSAVLNSVGFNSLSSALDTQSNSPEQLKFVIADSTGASDACSIAIVQSAVTVETITLTTGVLGATLDGTYYSKGGYDGSSAAISIVTTGSLTSATTATIAATGVDYSTNTYTLSDTMSTVSLEQLGRIEDGSNSQFLRGVIPGTCTLAYDRAVQNGMLTAAWSWFGMNMTRTTATTFQQDAAYYYRPIMGWHGAVTVDAVANLEVKSLNLNINTGAEIYAASSGTRYATSFTPGEFEVEGTIVFIPADNSRITDFEAATERNVDFTFTSNYTIGNSQAYVVTLELPILTLADYTPGHDGVRQIATVPVRGIYDSTHSGAARLTTICRRSL